MRFRCLLSVGLASCIVVPSDAQQADESTDIAVNSQIPDQQQDAVVQAANDDPVAAALNDAANQAAEKAQEAKRQEAAARRIAAVQEAIQAEVQIDDPPEDVAGIDFVVKPLVQKWAPIQPQLAGATQASQSRRFDLTIADMKNVCGLSDQQTQKLRLAAKGAMAQTTDEAPAPAQPQQAGVEIRKLNVNELAIQQRGFVTVFSAKQANPLEGRFWKAAVDKVLTDEQKAKYEAKLAARAKQTQQAVIDLAVAKLDQDLLLSDEQKVQVREAIANKKTAHQAGNVFRVIGHDSSGLDENDLQPILTPGQLAEWKSKHQPQEAAFAPVLRAPAVRMFVKPKP